MSFEDVMTKRLSECGAEACREVRAGLNAGRSLADAVLDAIESLPARKTRELRQWVDDWEAWEEWDGFKSKGWHIQKSGDNVYLRGPSLSPGKKPSMSAIAVGAGVRAVKFGGEPALQLGVYKVNGELRIAWMLCLVRE